MVRNSIGKTSRELETYSGVIIRGDAICFFPNFLPRGAKSSRNFKSNLLRTRMELISEVLELKSSVKALPTMLIEWILSL